MSEWGWKEFDGGWGLYWTAIPEAAQFVGSKCSVAAKKAAGEWDDVNARTLPCSTQIYAFVVEIALTEITFSVTPTVDIMYSCIVIQI